LRPAKACCIALDLFAAPRPNGADELAFYMAVEMNRMTKLGHELTGMIGDEIIMTRPSAR
jgi:hypothetical protein